MLTEATTLLTYTAALGLARQYRSSVSRLILHWTAGHYDQCFDDYHINIDGQGRAFLTCRSLAELKENRALSGCERASVRSEDEQGNRRDESSGPSRRQEGECDRNGQEDAPEGYGPG